MLLCVYFDEATSELLVATAKKHDLSTSQLVAELVHETLMDRAASMGLLNGASA